MKTPKTISYAWAFLLLALAVIFIQSVFRPLREIKLHGAFFVPEAKPFSSNSWLDGTFQYGWTERLNRQFAFLPDAIRLNNQFDYTLFGLHTDQVVSHADGRLYESGYLPALCGEDFIGNKTIQAKVDSLETLHRYLASKGKPLILASAPTKWRTFLPPEERPCNTINRTNYDGFRQAFDQSRLNWIDGIQLFQHWKDSLPHPVHSKNGTHWSIYGATHFAKKLVQVAMGQGISLPPFSVSEIEVSDEARNTDKDLADLLNLMVRPPDEDLAYPVLVYGPTTEKPTALVLGDSYYWTFYYLGLHQHFFNAESSFLYYNKTRFGTDRNVGKPLSPEERLALLEKADIVIILAGEPSFAHYGYGFLKDVWPVISQQ